MLSFYDYCVDSGKEYLLSRWDGQRNGETAPTALSFGSNRSVWWRCEKGHEWQAQIGEMSRSASGCPVCAGKTVLRGYNDLASQYPEIAAQWDAEKNGHLAPDNITAGSSRRVWWRCEKGHEWQADVKSRTKQKTSCPYCAGKKVLAGYNDLATLRPDIAAQWDTEKNGELSPRDVAAGSSVKAWWMCEKGHEWQAHVRSRTGEDSGCPYCTGKKVLAGFNDLATLHPTIAAQWNAALNGDLKPTEVGIGCNRRVWWTCEEGHTWRTAVCARTAKRRHTGCPVCSGFYSRSTLYKPEKE